MIANEDRRSPHSPDHVTGRTRPRLQTGSAASANFQRATAFRPPVQEPVLAGFAVFLVGLYLGLHAFFAPEFMPIVLGVYFPIVALLAALLPVIWLLISPQPLRFLETGIAKTYVILFVWWMVSALLMSFKGYAVEMMQYGIRFHTVPLIFCGILVSVRQVRMALLGYSSGFLVALLLCWKYGQPDAAGRLCISGTSLGNPNDLALNLLLGSAFLSILVVNGNVAKRILFVLSIAVTMYFILKTGSRGIFLTLVVLLLLALKVASGRVRMIMVVAGVAMGILLAGTIPKRTWIRLTTFNSAAEEEIASDQYLAGAIGSTEARKQLQIRALKLTVQNPVFGVGPRMFIYALNDHMKMEGYRKGSWQHPHNTYLDISSETGLVGLGLYLSCIIWCIRTNYRSVSATKRRPALHMALAQSCSLFLASLVFGIGTLFCSIPYVGHMPFLLGLTAANWLALRDAGAFNVPVRVAQFASDRAVAPRSRVAKMQQVAE